MPEKEILKKSGIYTIITLLGLSVFWFLFSIQTSFGYSGTGTTQDLKSGSRMNGDLLAQPLNGSVTIYFGTQSTQGTGTTGYIGTNTTGLPFLRHSFLGGSSSVNFNGFNAIYIDGIAIPSASSINGKLDAVGGVGTNNTFNNLTLAGLGTITASFGANGLVISPAEYASVNNATGELQAQIATATGNIASHTHTGSDGTSQVSHTNLTNKGTQTHTQIDDFIASKAAASGIASLDGSSLVVQNPASGTSTPGTSKTVMSDGTGKISDGWLSMGSLSVNALGDVNINMSNEGDFAKIIGGQLVAGSSSVTTAFSEVTGSATASQLPSTLGGMTFTGDTSFTGNVGAGTATPKREVHIASVRPDILIEETDAAVNEKMWRITADSGVLAFGTTDDTNLGDSIDFMKFLREGVDPRVSDIIFQTNVNAERMRINVDGNIGVGTPTPSAQLHTTGSVRFATLGAGAVQSDANGNLSVSSDERLKIVQGAFTSNLEAILGIEPVLYKYNELSGLDQDNTYVGFLAQNVMQYIPKAVGKDSSGYYTFNDRPVIAVLVNCVKELQKEIEELQKMNNIALKDYNVIALTDKTKIIKTKEIKLEKTEIKQGEETHEYIEEGFEDNFWEVSAVNALENVAEYEERRIIDTESVIPEWELQGTSTVLVQKTVYSFRTEKIQTGTKTVTRQGIEFNKWNNKFYRKTQTPKMIYKMKSGYEFKDGKFYRTETLEEAKARRIAKGID